MNFHETMPVASNENRALKLEVDKYDSMLELESDQVQLQNKALRSNQHFEHKSGFFCTNHYHSI